MRAGTRYKPNSCAQTGRTLDCLLARWTGRRKESRPRKSRNEPAKQRQKRYPRSRHAGRDCYCKRGKLQALVSDRHVRKCQASSEWQVAGDAAGEAGKDGGSSADVPVPLLVLNMPAQLHTLLSQGVAVSADACKDSDGAPGATEPRPAMAAAASGGVPAMHAEEQLVPVDSRNATSVSHRAQWMAMQRYCSSPAAATATPQLVASWKSGSTRRTQAFRQWLSCGRNAEAAEQRIIREELNVQENEENISWLTKEQIAGSTAIRSML